MAEAFTPELSPRLLERCRYRRLCDDSGVVLMIDAGYFIQRECLRGFRQLGWRVVRVPLEPPELFIERLLTAVVVHRPDLLFTVNHLGFDRHGALTGLLESIELPWVSWFVDSPAYILLEHTANASPLAMTPVWERNYEPFLRGFGFEHLFHLPLAGDPGLFRVDKPPEGFDLPVGLVADSMDFAAGKWLSLSPSFPGRERLIATAARRLTLERRAEPVELVRQAASNLQVNLPDMSLEEELTLSSAVVLEATRMLRRQVARELGEFGLHLFGDGGWRSVMPAGARLHDPVDYYSELPSVYSRTAVNINVTSCQMPTAVNQRVFDAPLAGGFLLTDRQEDLELMFEVDREAAVYSHPDEMPELVRYFLPRHSLRGTIASRAKARILAEHTYAHRIGEIIARARRAFASGPATVAATV